MITLIITCKYKRYTYAYEYFRIYNIYEVINRMENQQTLFLMDGNKIRKIIILLNIDDDAISRLNSGEGASSVDYNEYLTDIEQSKINESGTSNISDMVLFSNTQLYIDDTIYMICNKIIDVFKFDDIRTEELYLYTIRNYDIDSKNFKDYKHHVINRLLSTLNNSTSFDINTYISNHYANVAHNYSDDYKWDFDKLDKIITENQTKCVPLSIENSISTMYIEPHKYINEQFQSTHRYNVQLGDIIHSTTDSISIYISIAKQSMVHLNLDNSTDMIRLYYPLLAEKGNIESIDQYDKHVSAIDSETNKVYKQIYALKKKLSTSNKDNGNPIRIVSMNLHLIPQSQMAISIHSLFQILPIDKQTPLIKLTHKKHSRENFIRLYTEAQSPKTNEWIPYITRSDINKVIGDTEQENSVLFYVIHGNKKNIIPLNIEVSESGKCLIGFNGRKINSTDMYENSVPLSSNTNDIIYDIFNKTMLSIDNKYQQHVSYLPFFTDIYSDNVFTTTNTFIKTLSTPTSKVFKNLISIQSQISYLFRHKSGDGKQGYMEYTYVGYYNSTNNSNCTIRIQYGTNKSKNIDIILSNINSLILVPKIMEYVENLIVFVSCSSFNANKFDIVRPDKQGIVLPTPINLPEPSTITNLPEPSTPIIHTDIVESTPSNSGHVRHDTAPVNSSIFDIDIGSSSDDSDDSDDDMYGGMRQRPLHLNEYERYRINRITQRDPELMKNNKKVNNKLAWSALCSTSANDGKTKQPIIITEDEKKHIDNVSPGSYSNPYTTGSDAEHQHHYICPRYWCPSNNISLLPEDILPTTSGDTKLKSDKCKTPSGTEYGEILEGPEGSWFAKSTKRACVPCCFKQTKNGVRKYNEKDVSSKCFTQSDTSKSPANDPSTNVDNAPTQVDAIDHIKNLCTIPLNYNVFPTPATKISEIPLNVKLLFDINISNLYCLGIENNNNQSFIGCLATLYYYINMLNFTDTDDYFQNNTILSIKQFKSKLLDEVITIDLFISIYNGNLPTIFYSTDTPTINITSDIADSRFYKSATQQKEQNSPHIKKIIASYINFKDYLKSDTSSIDYTYLWDIVASKTSIFASGLNLVIIEMSDAGIDSPCRIVCPTNYYSNNKFDTTKRTIILLKNLRGQYDIIIQKSLCSATSNTKSFKMTTVFNYTNSAIGSFLPKIKRLYSNKYCGVYSNTSPHNPITTETSARHIKQLLESFNFTCVNQVTYYNGKIIGLIMKYTGDNKDIPTRTIFVPCTQSSIIDDINTISISNASEIFSAYSTTKDNIEMLRRITRKRYPITFKNNIVLNNTIIGIESHNELMIPIYPHIKRTDPDAADDSSKTVHSYGVSMSGDKYNTIFDVDQMLSDYKSGDTGTISIPNQDVTVQSDYEKFRYTVRTFINNNQMFDIKQDIIIAVESPFSYDEKMKAVMERLHTLFKKDIPSKSNISRLSDELIRHNRIRGFITMDNIYWLLTPNMANTSDNEILIHQLSIDSLPKAIHESQLTTTDHVAHTSNTTLPESEYILDYNDGVELSKLDIQSDIESSEPRTVYPQIVDYTDDKMRRYKCGTRCVRGTVCADMPDGTSKCIIKQNVTRKIKKSARGVNVAKKGTVKSTKGTTKNTNTMSV